MADLRAAVIGASGIGKHHAKWYARLGCSVDAFAGTSEVSVAATSEALRGLLGFEGAGYVGVGPMFDAGHYDVVSICSPTAAHHEHFMAAIDHGAHVICEKPLVYDASQSHDRLMAQAEEMVRAAGDAGIIAAINTQYVAAVGAYRELMAERGVVAEEPTSFFMQMESRGGDEGTDFENIWLDLASHPLSVLIGFCGPGQIVPGTESCVVTRKRVEAQFDYRPRSGPTCRAQIVCANRPEGGLVRRLGVNGALVDYEGRNDESGVYRAYLSCNGHETVAQDFVEASIERFLSAVRGEVERPLATAEDGLNNLRMQLHLLALAERA